MKPGEYIRPVFGMDDNLNAQQFLGTGAFVGEKPLLATAAHVVRDWSGLFAILDSRNHFMLAKLVTKNEDVDLALLEVAGHPSEKALQLAQDNEIAFNRAVACFEYSLTRFRGRVVYQEAATRVGNVTRLVDERELFGKAGEDALELSFPALCGASGAPVVDAGNFRLWGIVIANVGRHLLPSQVTTTLDEKNQLLEEIKYFLPQALAVHVKHLRAMLEDFT